MTSMEATVTDLIVRRWARYGHERLYAEAPGGNALGYLDVKTGRYHSEDPASLPLLREAIAGHLAAAAQPHHRSRWHAPPTIKN